VPLILPPAEWALADDYAAVFGSEAGRRVAADLFGFCHLDGARPLVGDGPIDPYRTHVHVGHLEVWQRIATQRAIAQETDRRYPEPTPAAANAWDSSPSEPRT
jgi:hypothetical protein